MAGPRDNTKIIQLRFNLNKETDRRLYSALEQSLLGATSAAIKHAVTLMLMQMQGQPQAVVPVQPQAPAPAHSVSVAAPPVPVVAAEPAVTKPILQPIPESKHEQIEPHNMMQNIVQNAAQNTSNLDQKPASENSVQNDVSESRPVIKVSHNFG